MLKILVVDDERKWRELIGGELSDRGHTVVMAADGQEALDLLEDGEAVDLILTDLKMEPVGGLELMRKVRERAVGCDMVMLTAYADTSTAVEAMKLGAYDFLTKPFELDELGFLVGRVEEKRGLARENQALTAFVEGGDSTGGMVGDSAAMGRVLELIAKVAATEATVLIRGESGTGKELVARMIHARSARTAGSFKAVNCAALPETLLESELFGHEKGAFTGAEKRRIGLFEAAQGGTLFLDEIGEVSPSVQSKLLRALEEREITRIGSTMSISVDTRVLAATHVDLEAGIQEGVFREDLFYRLNVFPIVLPPLRERRTDVPALAAHFLDELALGEKVVLDSRVAELLSAYRWPGNVRELRNVIERATILAGGAVIGPEHIILPDDQVARTAGGLELPAEGVNLEDVEAALMRQALERAGGNKSQAARLLGITRRALYCRMEKHGIQA